jgi:putative spermidine/putrescine transport system ATP-binding protein
MKMTLAKGFATVSIRSLSKEYGATRALDNVSLEVKEGEFVSLLGPSGSGKTTLLNILGGFILPTSGEVYFGDTEVSLLQPHARNIGVVFQNYALFPHMTVGKNVAYPLAARGVGKAERERRVKDALKLVELGGYENRGVLQLSGGQKQRVALARAIVFEPKLILLDEPLSALDKQLRESMQLELRNLHAKLGATMIYVTHDQREALTMSDRIAVMRNGRIDQVGTPRDLYNFPKNDFIASFVGESTLLPVSRASTGGFLVAGATCRSAHPVPHGERLALVVNAEKLILDNSVGGEDWNCFDGQIVDAIYQGESVKLSVRLEDGTLVSLRQHNHHRSVSTQPMVGAQVRLGLHVQDTVLVPVLGVGLPMAVAA